jgi:hypothetical protein
VRQRHFWYGRSFCEQCLGSSAQPTGNQYRAEIAHRTEAGSGWSGCHYLRTGEPIRGCCACPPYFVGAFEPSRLDLRAVQPADQPLGGLSINIFVRKTKRAEDSGIRSVLGRSARERDMAEFDAAERKRVERALMMAIMQSFGLGQMRQESNRDLLHGTTRSSTS